MDGGFFTAWDFSRDEPKRNGILSNIFTSTEKLAPVETEIITTERTPAIKHPPMTWRNSRRSPQSRRRKKTPGKDPTDFHG